MLTDRFWSKVDRSPGPEGCWLWMASRDREGYGRFWVGPEPGMKRAHTAAWEAVNGPVPEGLVLDHIKCDNPGCVNPAHLTPTTIWENSRRGNSPASINAAKMACDYGHDLSDPSVARTYKGHRICRPCDVRRHRKQRAEVQS